MNNNEFVMEWAALRLQDALMFLRQGGQFIRKSYEMDPELTRCQLNSFRKDINSITAEAVRLEEAMASMQNPPQEEGEGEPKSDKRKHPAERPQARHEAD